MTEKIKITVAIIAKNEEKKIAKCLESVRWADEVVVVDGFSQDKTVEIANSYGAKVIQHKFTGSFADERNVGMDSARNDWVLHIDADDVVTEVFRVKLELALAGNEDMVVYKFRRKNFFLGHPMDHGGFHHYIPNLVNRRFARYEGAVHEIPVYRGRAGVIEADIEHFPFDSIAQFVDRQNRYTDIAARGMLKDNGILHESEIKKRMLARAFKAFWKSYVKKQGYREGFYGLLFAILFSFIEFAKWAKYWELTKKGNNA